MRVSRYPSFCEDEMSYPIMRSSLMCFQTAERVMPSSLLMVSPEIGASDLSRISITLNAESGVDLTSSNCWLLPGSGQGSLPHTCFKMADWCSISVARSKIPVTSTTPIAPITCPS